MVGSSPTLLFSEYFGTLNLETAAILSFPQGLPGFENERRFAAIQIPGQHPLVYLQSLQTPELCLLTFPVATIDPEYRLCLGADDCETLQLPQTSDENDASKILTLSIVTLDPEAGATANLAAPLVVNLTNLVAVQALQPKSGQVYNFPLPERLNLC